MGDKLQVELGCLDCRFALIIGNKLVAEKDSRVAISIAKTIMIRMMRLLMVDLLFVMILSFINKKMD